MIHTVIRARKKISRIKIQKYLGYEMSQLKKIIHNPIR